ncbi:MAG: esterase/lipase family protein [Chthoniobacterales bacterium]
MIIETSHAWLAPRVFPARTPETAHAPEPIETVLLIHGTFANNQHEGDADWWLPGSEFCGDMDARLQAAGAKAKCWAHLPSPVPFAWTGANSERARRSAGRALRQELEALEANPRVRRYHVVSHSHGGNVVLNAVGDMLASPRKLGAVIYLGTPVLTFHHRVPLDPRWIALPLYALLLAASVWELARMTDARFWLGLLIAALFLVLLVECAWLFKKRPSGRAGFYGSGKPSAFLFAQDEAMDSLKIAQGITRDPGRFVDQFIRTEPPPPPAITPTVAREETIEDQARKTGAYVFCRALEEAEPGSLPFSGQQPHATAQSKAGKFLVDLGNVVPFGAPVIAFVRLVFGALAIGPLLLPLLVTGVVGLLLRIVGWIARGLTMQMAKGFARTALPVLVRKAAMGADQGRFVEVRELPDGVSALEDLKDVAAEATEVSKRLAINLAEATMRSIVAMDAFAIKNTVIRALSDAALVHSHYYRSAEVRARIVQLIDAAAKNSEALPLVRP